MWYNSTDGSLRGIGVLEAWASISPTITTGGNRARFGTTASAIAAGGEYTSVVATTASEEWNGSGWSATATLNTARNGLGGVGLETAGLVFGGQTGPGSLTGDTEEWNGSAWSEQSNMSNDHAYTSGFGTQTAGAIAGGNSPTPGGKGQTNVEHYNGSSWTAGGALPAVNRSNGSFGTQTAGVNCGGLSDNPGATVYNTTFEYDGSSWTASGNLATATRSHGTAGTQTVGLAYGGTSSPGPYLTTTQKYDGSTWSTSPGSLGTAVTNVNGTLGTGTAAISNGGYNTAWTNQAEEYNISTNAITAAAWSSGGTYPYAAANTASLGPATAMLTCGGNNSGPTKQTTVNLYNGTSYSAETGIPSATNGMGSGKGGTETAGLIFGGSAPGGNTTATILYNGSSWTSGGALSTARRNLGGLGISTAALAFGGQEPSYSTATEEYGGSSWTSGGALPAARRNATGVGSQTAGLVLAGQSPPGAGINTSFTYNGTSYSGGPTMVNSRSDAAASGPNSSNTSALVYGGSVGSSPYAVILQTESYDGSSFSTAPNLSTGRDGQGSGASSTEGVQVAGYVPSGSYLSSTEQFTPETTAANLTDFTTS